MAIAESAQIYFVSNPDTLQLSYMARELENEGCLWIK